MIRWRKAEGKKNFSKFKAWKINADKHIHEKKRGENMPRLKEIRIAKGRQQKELALKVGTDEPMMSRFENYKCLPIPSMLARLTEELECSVEDIYQPHEIYSSARPKIASAPKKANNETYRVTVKLRPEARGFLKTALKKCGYKDITDWVNRCLEKTMKQYDKLIAKEKDLTSAGKRDSEV